MSGSDANSQGFSHFADANGAATLPTRVEKGETRNDMGKTNGLGDIEVLCDQAPLEIGNRVWLDANRNGSQDPTEAGIDGVTLTLRLDGATVATTVTADGGSIGSGPPTSPVVFVRSRTIRSWLMTSLARRNRLHCLVWC